MAAPPTLQISGNKLVTSTGCVVTLRGVDVDGLEFSPTGYGPTGGTGGNTLEVVQEAVTAWHCNIIRLPLNQDFWFGCGNTKDNSPPTAATYQAAVSQIVSYCSSQNVYVILDLHWSGTASAGSTPTGNSSSCGGGWDGATGQQPMADANAPYFWTSVATQYKTNTAVIFDLYNEPYDAGNDNISPPVTDTNGYKIWLEGSAAAGATLGGANFQTAGMQQLLNAVRGTGANNVCLLGGLHWCANLNGLPASSVTNVGNGVMFAGHLYGDAGSVDDGDSPVSWDLEIPSSFLSNYPVFIGEYGPTATQCNTDDTTFDTNIIGSGGWAVTTTGIVGCTAWSMTTNSCPNLLSNWTWGTETWGAAVSTFLAVPVPTCSGGGSPVPTDTPQNTPTATATTVPPKITLTKTTGGPVSGYLENGTPIPMTITVCNATGSVTANGVTVVDAITNPLSWSQDGPNYSPWTVTVSGVPVSIDPVNTTGFPITWIVSNLPGGACVPINFNVVAYSFNSSDSCQVVSDHGTASWSGGGPVSSNTIAVTVVCLTPTPTPSPTSLPPTNTATPTASSSPTKTNTPLPTATSSPTSTPTRTATPTATNTVANTATFTLTPTRTNTATNSPTPTATNTSANTATNTPTSTATSSRTNTAVNTATNTATTTSTNTVANTPTNTPTNSQTNTATATRTSTATNTPTFTSTLANTATDTSTATVTPTRTATSTSTNTATVTATLTATSTATSTSTATRTNTPTASFTPTITDTATITSTPTNTSTGTLPATNTPTNTATVTDSFTATHTATSTDTSTATLTATKTATPTFTRTLTNTATQTATSTATNTPANTATATSTVTNTLVNTATATNTLTNTATHTPTLTPTDSITPSATASSTPTSTSTSSWTASASPTLTHTATLTVTITDSPTNTQTGTLPPTSTPTNTPTVTDSFTATSTATLTPTDSTTPTSSATLTATSTASSTPTATGTATITSTPTNTSTGTQPPTNTPTNTSTKTDTLTATHTTTSMATSTPTNSLTPTATLTPTNTLVSTATFTATPTPTATEAIVNASSNPPAGSTQLPGATQVPAAQVQFNTASASPVTLTQLTVSMTGSGNTADITQLTLWDNGNQVGTATVSSGVATFSLTNNNFLTSSVGVTYTVKADFNGSASGTYVFNVSGAQGTNGQMVQFTGLPTVTTTVTVTAATSTPTASTTPTSTLTPISNKTPVVFPNPSTGGPVMVLPPVYTGTADITIRVYTVAFRMVKEKSYPSQTYGPISLDLVDNRGTPLASGLYYVVVTTPNSRQVIKLLLLR